MAYKPQYLVTGMMDVTRPVRGSEYTGTSEREPFFKVSLTHGYFPGVGVDLYYENAADAGNYALHQLIDASAIIDDSNIRGSLDVEDVKRIQNVVKHEGGVSDTWRVSMSHRDGAIDLWSADEGEAQQFGEGKSFEMIDIFGTLPSIPFDVGDELAAKAFRAAYAADELALAQANAELAKLEADAAREAEIARSPAGALAKAQAAAAAAARAQARQQSISDAGNLAYSSVVATEQQKADALRAQADQALMRASMAQFRGDTATASAENALWSSLNKQASAVEAGEGALGTAAANAAVKAQTAVVQKEIDAENNALKIANEKKQAALAALQNARNNASNATKALKDKGDNPKAGSTAQWHSISHGGAAGYYDGELYETGKFGETTKISDGQWFGTFVRK